jgi:hypothetical protein
MRRLSLVVALAVVLALSASGLLFAQRRGGRAMPPERVAPARGPTTDAERVAEFVEPLGLPAKEQAAAEKALTAKLRAHRELRQQFEKLQDVAADKSASRQQLSRAFDDYTKAVDRYQSLVRSEDRALVAKLSPRGRVVCLAAGVLDNGMGLGARRGGGGGGGGRGGPGGGRGGPGGGGRGGGPRGGRGG